MAEEGTTSRQLIQTTPNESPPLDHAQTNHVPTATLCSRCDAIRISRRTSTWEYNAGTVYEVQDSAKAGCRFCKLLEVALYLVLQQEENGSAWAQEASVMLYQPPNSNHFYLQPQPHPQNYFTRVLEVSLIDVPEIFADEYQDRPEVSDPSSIELIEGWLGNCQKSHTMCETAKQTILPTRVLCVGKHGDETISVWVPGHGDKGSYLALSYCWGNGATVTATPEALPRLLSGFSLSKLPRTLREAVQTTRNLGFVYFWIDSLCILQGKSPQARLDWVQESARMDEIYANAVITIIASASSSCDQGLFYPRTCQMQYEGTFVTLSISGYPRSYKDEPIHKRAWTLQERLLSSRVLSYCLQDLMWECNEAMLWERGPPVLIARIHKERLQGEKFDWTQITRAYASRSITIYGDKLPALSAVAKRYHESSHDQYLAGLWREDLLKQLLWSRSSHKNVNSPSIRPSVLLEYRAPSWSWASLDCSIWSSEYNSSVATVVSCSVKPATADPFGMVSEGELVIKSPFLLVSIVLKISTTEIRVNGQRLAYVHPDENDIIKREDADTSKPTSAIVIAALGNSHHGLLLQPSKAKPDCYVRIGMFATPLNCKHWFLQKAKEFTII